MKELETIFQSVSKFLRLQEIVNWLNNLLTGKCPYWFEHNHNLIKSNVDKEILLKTRNTLFSEMGIKHISVQYPDGVISTFNEPRWHVFGDWILKNCAKIKVIVVSERTKNKR